MPHSTPASQALAPVQRTTQGIVPGHVTLLAHSPGPSHSTTHVPSMHDVHGAGQPVLASISEGSTTHQPLTQSRPGPH